MRKNPVRLLLSLFGLFLLLPACASTQLTAVWKDPAFQDQPRKIMVIGMLPNPASKRTFEEEMVKSLKKQGTDAIVSYTLLPEQPAPDREAVEKTMKEQGADAVIIARIMDKKTVTSYVPSTPGPRYGAPGYYGTSWQGYYAYNPGGGYRKDEFAVVQTNLYDLKTEKLIWTASSETWLANENRDLIMSYIDVVMRDLIKEKIVVPGKGK